MKSLLNSFSHINICKRENNPDFDWSKPSKLDEILESRPRFAETYDNLVKDVAQILHRHRNLTLFYRGQNADYQENNRTAILPSIYRKTENSSKLFVKKNFDILKIATDELRKSFNSHNYIGRNLLNRYPEIAWSLLQHYEVCKTPLLDLTHSLHVACSFAFDRNNNKTGIIYLIGMPWQMDAIGYNSYEELVNIKLLCVCPPRAQRPFFQEGYLAGPFPNYRLDDSTRVEQFDFGRRLIAKFEIPIENNFWGNGFSRIPVEKLYQPDDRIKKLCDQLEINS
jgi:hypothetical protein